MLYSNSTINTMPRPSLLTLDRRVICLTPGTL